MHLINFFSLKKNADTLLAAATGFFIICLFTSHSGIGLEPDGVVFFTSAQNLRATGTLSDFSHKVVVEFPAFYPLFLSGLIVLTGLTPLAFAPFLNALLFALMIYISGCIMEKFSPRSTWYKRALLSCIVFSPGLLEVYSMLWTETLFIIWLLLFMMAMHRYFKVYSRKALIAAAFIASVACITRYAGVTIIATGAILLLLDMELPVRKKLADLIIYSAISPLLLVINLIRNYIVGGSMTGNREGSLTSLHVNLQDAGIVFYNWLPFLHGKYKWAAWIVAGLITVLLFICVKNFLKNHRLSSYQNMAAGFSLLYILFMIATACLSRFETLNSRFFSPAFIPLIWSCSSWIIPLASKTNKVKKYGMLIFGACIFAGFQYGQLSVDLETWDGVKDAGIPGYTEDQWKYSEIVLFLQKGQVPFKKDFTIYSDASDAIYFFTGKQAKFLPGKEFVPAIKEFLNDPHCYVVWFNDGENADLVDRNFIVNTKGMKLVHQFSDGAIYKYGE